MDHLAGTGSGCRSNRRKYGSNRADLTATESKMRGVGEWISTFDPEWRIGGKENPEVAR
jgi:hypothetical protein